MAANCLLSVLDMNYATYSRKHAQYIYIYIYIYIYMFGYNGLVFKLQNVHYGGLSIYMTDMTPALELIPMLLKISQD